MKENMHESEVLINRISQPDTLPAPHIADSLYLDEIHVRSTRIHDPLRYQPVDIQFIDSLRLNIYGTKPVSAALSRYSSLFIRDNGPGGVATLSQRGLSASQTQVLWEGFPINSLSLGLADLSMISAGLFDSMEISPGTPSSTFGGGSLGGTVYLSSSGREQSNRIELAQSAGEFGTWNSQFKSAFTEGSWSGSVRGIYHTAENDFSYFNRATGREERRTNNAGRSINLMGNTSYEMSNARIYSSVWYFDSRNNIPGSILANSSEAVQSQEGVRWSSGVDLAARGWNVSLRTFLERDRFGFVDPRADIDSRFRRGRGLAEVDFRRPSLDRIIWQGGISGGLEMVDTNNFGDKRRRQLLGLRLNPDIRIPEWNLRLHPAVRADAYSGFSWVLSPSMGANWEVFEDRLHLKGMISQDFNPPSFNDLYWVPGGNPDLEAERSLKTEGGIVYLPDLPIFESFRLTGYRIWLENGIYWFPDREGIWSPSNVEEVDAFGAEAMFGMNWNIRETWFDWNFGIDWRRAEVAGERFPGDQAVGRQMRYVPEWAFRSDVSVRIGEAMLHANYGWTSRRYVTEDHTSSLEGFQIMDVAFSIGQDFLGANWHLQVSANNLLNEQYEIIQWFPMPGRHFEITLGMGLPM